MVLRETNHSGQADSRQSFATGFTSSEVALFEGYVYTEALPPRPPAAAGAPAGGRGGPQPTIAILRYPLKAGELVPSGAPDTIVSGLPGLPGHSTRNFVITREGVMYVNVGSMTNSCQSEDRKKGIPGVNPCTELETRAGIWKLTLASSWTDGSNRVHFARGIRTRFHHHQPVDGKLWTTQHGRDNPAGRR
jgi:glucose/arabinose dehydrogenase